MAKVHKIVDPVLPCSSTHHPTTDWSKCLFCQRDSEEVLRCPQKTGYSTIADLLLGFSNISCLPRSLNLSRLDDGEGIVATLNHHQAKWHDSCRLKYNKTELRRAKKRARPLEEAADTGKKCTRQSLEQTCTSSEACFFVVNLHRLREEHQPSGWMLMSDSVPSNCRTNSYLQN